VLFDLLFSEPLARTCLIGKHKCHLDDESLAFEQVESFKPGGAKSTSTGSNFLNHLERLMVY